MLAKNLNMDETFRKKNNNAMALYLKNYDESNENYKGHSKDTCKRVVTNNILPKDQPFILVSALKENSTLRSDIKWVMDVVDTIVKNWCWPCLALDFLMLYNDPPLPEDWAKKFVSKVGELYIQEIGKDSVSKGNYKIDHTPEAISSWCEKHMTVIKCPILLQEGCDTFQNCLVSESIDVLDKEQEGALFDCLPNNYVVE